MDKSSHLDRPLLRAAAQLRAAHGLRTNLPVLQLSDYVESRE